MYGQRSRCADGTLDNIEIDTVQPREWIAEHRAEVGREVPIPLDLVEMGIPADTLARVTSIDPCPPIPDGPGHLVLTAVNHLNNDVYELTIEDAHGKQETDHPTGFHKMFSEERDDWVSVCELRKGEKLGGLSELTVVSVQPLPGVHRVYNFTVEGQHVYHVGTLGALAHNTGCGKGFSNPDFGTAIHQRFEEALTAQTGTEAYDWIIRTAPGLHGVDATYIGPAKRFPGFRHAELKPNSNFSF